jgi:hypothetical protein
MEAITDSAIRVEASIENKSSLNVFASVAKLVNVWCFLFVFT